MIEAALAVEVALADKMNKAVAAGELIETVDADETSAAVAAVVQMFVTKAAVIVGTLAVVTVETVAAMTVGSLVEVAAVETLVTVTFVAVAAD